MLASTASVLITEDDPDTPGASYQACLRSVGEERTLFDGATGADTPSSAAVSADGGDDVALAWVEPIDSGSTRTSRTTASIYDLRTGTVLRQGLASEPCGQPDPPGTTAPAIDPAQCLQYVDDLSLSDGMLAMHVTSFANDPFDPAIAELEQVISSDADGTEVQEDVSRPETLNSIFGVTITGDTLGWQDDGTYHTVALTPPS